MIKQASTFESNGVSHFMIIANRTEKQAEAVKVEAEKNPFTHTQDPSCTHT